mgnify:CR=1 FL=1
MAGIPPRLATISSVASPPPALDDMKFEIARELGVDVKGYGGDLTARENGAIGGSMTKKLIEQAQRQLSSK